MPFFYVQSTPQQPQTQVQHTQSMPVLPPMPSLVNNMHPQQQPLQSLKPNASLPQQPPPPNIVQTQNALNNNDVNQQFSTQSLNPNLNLSALLGRHFFYIDKF